ncbi:hypothetical protein Ddc_18715 [Ditylenchus destructor]|nr:hypothetical protein Ddc_18715 [Ditylenchus destructor]
MDSEPQLDIDVGKDSDKFALFKKIQEHKGILFGKFSPNVTKESKEETWNQIRAELIHDGHEFFREKTTKQMRDSIWSLSKTRTIKKYDNATEAMSVDSQNLLPLHPSANLKTRRQLTTKSNDKSSASWKKKTDFWISKSKKKKYSSACIKLFPRKKKLS